MKCSFCNQEIPKGTGKLFVRKDNTVFYFCSRRCEKNQLNLGRNPRYIKWTGLYEKTKKEIKK